MSLKSRMDEIRQLIDGFSGELAYSILDEQSGEIYNYRCDAVMPTASTMKVFCLARLLRMVQDGELSLDDPVIMSESNQVRGSGVLKELHLGLELTLRDACMLMVIVSDNTATNMVIDAVGGVAEVNRFLEEFGFEHCEIRNRLEFEKIKTAEDLAVATTGEFLQFLLFVRDSDYLNDAMKREYFNFLAHQQCVDQFPRYMPYNQYAAETYQPCEMQVYNKTGFMVEVRTDVGYIETAAGKKVTYAVFSDHCADKSFLAENEGNVVLGKIGRIVYEEILS